MNTVTPATAAAPDAAIRRNVATALGCPLPWVGNPERHHAGLDFLIMTDPGPTGRGYRLSLSEQGMVAAGAIRALEIAAAQVRGVMELDGVLYGVRLESASERSAVRDAVADARGFSVEAGSAGDPSRKLVTLTRLLGAAAESAQNGKSDQLRADLVQLAGWALAMVQGQDERSSDAG